MKIAALIVYVIYDLFGRPLGGIAVPVFVR